MDDGSVHADWNGRLLERLTPRELEILGAMTKGRATGEIAEGLNISPMTVQSHVKSILVKLGVHSKVEAVVLALRHGLSTEEGQPTITFPAP